MPRIPSRRGLGVVMGLGALLVLFLSSRVQSQPPKPAGQPGLLRFTPVDLQAKTNHKRNTSFHSGQYAGNTLASLATGEQTLQGIPFQVGEGVIQLGSRLLPDKPAKVADIPVGQKFSKLYILHATAYSTEEQDKRIGAYTVHYEDGTSATIPIVYGKDVLDWWNYPGSPEPTHVKVAWKGENQGAKGFDATIRLFLTTWENPHLAKTVTRIDYASTMAACAPFCVAMTAERPLKVRAAAGPVTAEDLEQLWKQLASDDNQASDAVETFAGVPQQAIPFLSARLRAVQPAATEKRIAGLISQLDDENVSVRAKATRELENLGREALPQLRWSLDRSLWLEVRHRIAPLVEKLKIAKRTADQTRLQRVLLVLELIGTVEARQVLEQVAKGSAGAWLAPEAQAALKRLEKTAD